MGFDLTSAVPVTKGFDLSSAGPDRKGFSYRSDVNQYADAGQAAIGVGETALQLVSGAIAEPIAGITGIAGSMLPGPEGQGARAVEKVRDTLTYQPRSEAGRAVSSAVALPIEIANRLLGKAGGAAGALIGPEAEAAGSTIGENLLPTAMAVYGGARAMRPMAEAVPMAGKDFSPLREFTPEQADRFYRMKAQGIEPTLGNVTRDPSQVRFEQQMAPTEGGARLLQRTKEQDAALVGNIEANKGVPPGTSTVRDIGVSEAETGGLIRTAVEHKQASRKQIIDDLYEEARASGETKAKVDVSPLIKYLAANEPAAIAVKELKSVSAGLKKLIGEDETPPNAPLGSGKISGRMKQSQSTKEKPTPAVTIDDIEFLRQEVGRLSQKDGSVRSYMGEVREIIDKITDGKGGDKYKRARAARKAYGDEFEEQLGVAGIADKRSRTDYSTAVEDVWRKTVVNGSEADLRNVLDSLSGKGPTDKAGMASKPTKEGLTAIKHIQNQTIDYIIERATEAGTLSPAGLRKAIRSIGINKLEMLLGRKTVGNLINSLRSAKDLKTIPPGGKVPGSDTVLNSRTMAERMAADHMQHIVKGVLPKSIGRFIDSVKDMTGKKAEARKMQADVDEALTPHRASLSDIEAQADMTRKERRKYLMNEGVSRAAPIAAATVLDDNEQ